MDLFRRFRCKHAWTKTYSGSIIASRYACTKCGKIREVEFYDEGAFEVRRKAKGETVE